MQRPVNGNTNLLACQANPECLPSATSVITGPITLCTINSGPATYTSPLQGPGYTYTWAASPASDFTVSSGSGPTFQTQEATSSGTGIITLTVNTGCEFSFSKRIVFGAPEPIDYTEDDVASDPCNKIVWYVINNYDPSLTYSGTGLASIGYGWFRVKSGGSATSKAFTVKVANDCGSNTISDVARFENCQGPTLIYAVYPNPADNQLTVEQTDSTSAQRGMAARGATATAATSGAAPATPYTVRLFDSYGVQQAQQATTSPTLSLPTGALPTGLYLLHIEVDGTVVERRRVQITH